MPKRGKDGKFKKGGGGRGPSGKKAAHRSRARRAVVSAPGTVLGAVGTTIMAVAPTPGLLFSPTPRRGIGKAIIAGDPSGVIDEAGGLLVAYKPVAGQKVDPGYVADTWLPLVGGIVADATVATLTSPRPTLQGFVRAIVRRARAVAEGRVTL